MIKAHPSLDRFKPFMIKASIINPHNSWRLEHHPTQYLSNILLLLQMSFSRLLLNYPNPNPVHTKGAPATTIFTLTLFSNLGN